MGNNNNKNTGNAPVETAEDEKLRLEKEQFEAEKAEFEATKTAEAEAKATAAEKLATKIEAFEADKTKLEEDKAQLEANQVQADSDAAAKAEEEEKKQAAIKDYKERVKEGNKELNHIDFNKTGIKNFLGDKVGKPTAKAPVKRKVNGEIVDIK